MPSYVADLLVRLFPPAEARVLCVGLDAAGRTSWLYSIIFPGERITTIPTVGFNVETVKHGGVSLTIWDVGGCDKIRPVWRHYFQNTQGLLFFVDANDHDRMDEMGAELRRLGAEEALRDAFILVIANKQDLPNAMSAAQVSDRLRLPEALAGRMWACLPGCLGDQQAVRKHLDWIVSAARHAVPPRPPAAPSAPSSSPASAAGETAAKKPSGRPSGTGGAAPGGGDVSNSPGAEAAAGNGAGGSEPDVLERWLRVEDEPDDEFLRKLEDFSLGVWDHRTHLRLAWLYLTRHGRREGLARIHASIRAFIQHSPLTKRKSGTTYHETMTYFWAHMVHFAIASQKVPPGATADFRLFLLLNPQLSNGGLFLHYYSKQLMLLTPESRDRVVLPDKRPLPSIVTDLAALSISEEAKRPAPEAARPAAAQQLTDAAFLERFLDRSLDRWNHECLLRSIYCCLSRHGRRRGGNAALDGLRALQGDGFHMTINYFWVAIVTHTLASEYATALFADRKPVVEPPPPPVAAAAAVAAMAPPAARDAAGPVALGQVAVPETIAAGGDAAEGVAGAEANKSQVAMALPEWPALLASGSYTSVRMRELVADAERYLKYYSKKVTFSDAAAAQFVPPNKRPLPSTV